jgi:hypothetical protein
MPRQYSNDFRARIIEAIEAGASRPLEGHAEFLLGLIVEQPDLTLDEIVGVMRKKRIPRSSNRICRFLALAGRFPCKSILRIPP